MTKLPAFLQTPGVVDANETGRSELASAMISNGETPKI
jgi:hypothetical protein